MFADGVMDISSVQKSGLLTVLWWTLSHRAFDTRKGKVGFAIVDHDNEKWLLGHFSVWHSILLQCYTGWFGRYRMSDLKKALRAVNMAPHTSTSALHRLNVLYLGTDVPKRHTAYHDHLVMIPWRIAQPLLDAMSRVPSVPAVMSACQDRTLTLFQLKEYINMGISTTHLRKKRHSHISDWASALSPSASTSTSASASLSPSPYVWGSTALMGFPWSREQLSLLGTTHHYVRWGVKDTETPVKTAAQLRVHYDRYGLVDDSADRPHAHRNHAVSADQQKLLELCQIHGIETPGPGRPTPADIPTRRLIQQIRTYIRTQRQQHKAYNNLQLNKSLVKQVKAYQRAKRRASERVYSKTQLATLREYIRVGLMRFTTSSVEQT